MTFLGSVEETLGYYMSNVFLDHTVWKSGVDTGCFSGNSYPYHQNISYVTAKVLNLIFENFGNTLRQGSFGPVVMLLLGFEVKG